MKFKPTHLIAALLAATTLGLRADLVQYPDGQTVAGPGDSSPGSEASYVSDQLNDVLGLNGQVLSFLGKVPIGDLEDPHGLIGNGSIQYQNLSGSSAQVQWSLTGYELYAVYVKSGSGGSTLYYVAEDQRSSSGGWEDILSISGQGISHISFFGLITGNPGTGGDGGGTNPPGERVPDAGSTLILLGTAMGSLGFLRRRQG